MTTEENPRHLHDVDDGKIDGSTQAMKKGEARQMQDFATNPKHDEPPAARRRIAGITALLCFIAGAGGNDNLSAQTSIYRCTMQDGSIEFRQSGCSSAQDSIQIEINDTRTGWTPPSGTALSAPKSDSTGGRRKKSAQSKEIDRYADRCWNKRQQIDRINNELRAGYKPQRGVKLRRRRSEYEAFLSRYCR
ncbi:MAG: hypothetical protein WBG92_11375 [Thiohalocapsa sp.]